MSFYKNLVERVVITTDDTFPLLCQILMRIIMCWEVFNTIRVRMLELKIKKLHLCKRVNFMT